MLKLLVLGQREIDQGFYKSMDDVFAELDEELYTSREGQDPRVRSDTYRSGHD
jgi:hypothetical protein